ncbi:MAG TPA: glycosyltransferase family 9 protein [Bacteroidales bacterium]|nr:glycosyltransferase family 9 protein [Bacteroidales bacterium]
MYPQPAKILVIQTASIGDVVLSTALAESLHQRFPQAIMHYLVRSGYESLFAGHPYISKVWVWEKRRHKYRSLFRLIGQVKAEKYDLVVNVQRFASSGLITVLSGARVTSGFTKNPLSRFFTHAYPHRIEVAEGSPHEVERNHTLLGFLDNILPSRPALYPSETDFKSTGVYKNLPYFTVSPASLWFTKQYPEEKWVELIGNLPRGHNIYLLGSKADNALCNRIIKTSGHPFAQNLSGKLSLLQSAALMKHARMNYTNDSAPMHLASAVNAPVAAIFCSTVPEFGFGPLSDMAFVVQTAETLSCRPCGLHGRKTCPEGHFSCAYGIQTAQLTKVL